MQAKHRDYVFLLNLYNNESELDADDIDSMTRKKLHKAEFRSLPSRG